MKHRKEEVKSTISQETKERLKLAVEHCKTPTVRFCCPLFHHDSGGSCVVFVSSVAVAIDGSSLMILWTW